MERTSALRLHTLRRRAKPTCTNDSPAGGGLRTPSSGGALSASSSSAILRFCWPCSSLSRLKRAATSPVTFFRCSRARRLVRDTAACTCGDAQVANRVALGTFRVGGRSRGRYATPADSPLHGGTPYGGLHVLRWGLGFVHRSRKILCRAVPTLKLQQPAAQGSLTSCLNFDLPKIILFAHLILVLTSDGPSNIAPLNRCIYH
jgi:hypothetical protein